MVKHTAVPIHRPNNKARGTSLCPLTVRSFASGPGVAKCRLPAHPSWRKSQNTHKHKKEDTFLS